MTKTNAMRILDSLKLDYTSLGYEVDDGKVDGLSVADKIGRDKNMVFKTLVTKGSREIYVFVLPVNKELDFKKAAKLTGEKKIEMIPVGDILKITGYVRGGCSPIGMKKNYRTFVDETARELSRIIVSGGRIGSQIEISLENLSGAIDLELAKFTKE